MNDILGLIALAIVTLTIVIGVTIRIKRKDKVENLKEIYLIASDFNNINSTWLSSVSCPIALACLRQFSKPNEYLKVREQVDYVMISDVKYKHQFYGYNEYYNDKLKAEVYISEGTPNRIVRTIILTKV